MGSIRGWWSRIHWIDQMGIMMLPIALGVLSLEFVRFPQQEFKDTLDGHFHLVHPALGDWKGKPTRCVSGLELGFEGIVFEFGEGSEVKQIRVNTTDKRDKLVQVFFANAAIAALAARQHECNIIGGTTDVTPMHYGDVVHYHLKGNTRVWCPTIGLDGRAGYRGCMPF